MSYLQSSGYKSPYGRYVVGATSPPPPAPLAPAFVSAGNETTYGPTTSLAGQFTYPANNVFGVSIRYGTEAIPGDFESQAAVFDDFPSASAISGTKIDFTTNGNTDYLTDYYFYSVSYLDALGTHTAVTVYGPVETFDVPPAPYESSLAVSFYDWTAATGFTLQWEVSADPSWRVYITNTLGGLLVDHAQGAGSGYDTDFYTGVGYDELVAVNLAQSIPTTPDANWGICDFYPNSASYQTVAGYAVDTANATPATAYNLGESSGNSYKQAFASVGHGQSAYFEIFTTMDVDLQDLTVSAYYTLGSVEQSFPTIRIIDSDGTTVLAEGEGGTTYNISGETTYYIQVENTKDDLLSCYLDFEYSGV